MENLELVDLHVGQDNTRVFFKAVSQEGGEGGHYDFIAPKYSIRAEDRKVEDILTQILKVIRYFLSQQKSEGNVYPEPGDEV